MTTSTDTQTKSNYEIFLDTINALKYSQGFYSRLAQQVEQFEPEQLIELENTLNKIPQWIDTVDCILYLEQ